MSLFAPRIFTFPFLKCAVFLCKMYSCSCLQQASSLKTSFRISILELETSRAHVVFCLEMKKHLFCQATFFLALCLACHGPDSP